MKKKNNILLIGNFPPPYGGVPLHIERLTEHLVKNGWNCHVLSGGTSGNQYIGDLTVYKPTYYRKILGLIRQSFEHCFRDWLAEGRLNRENSKLWRRYKIYADVGGEIIRANDIQLIVSYNLLTYAPIGAWLAEKFSLPHVINIFGEIYKYDVILSNKSFFSRVADSAFRMLSCSEHCGGSMKRVQVEAHVQAVTYGVDINHFTPDEEYRDLRTALGLGEGEVVLFVGRLGKEMGLDSFFAAARLAAKQFPDVCFVMVGQAGDLADQLQKECQKESGQFVMIRNAPYDDLPKYYCLASMVVVPTRGDRTCSSLAAMEAMATRKPVISFAIGGIPEIIEHEKTGLLVEPEDTQALADAMGRLLKDDDLCNELAEAGYQQAQIRFDERLVNLAMERHFLDALAVS